LQISLYKHIVYADIVTMINLCFGLSAILSLLSGLSELVSYSLILLAVLADGLDGLIARRTGSGAIGGYLEAMADMVSLSVSPTLLLYHSYNHVRSSLIVHVIMVLFLVIFNICSFLRLGLFHLMKDEVAFIGLPVSACTILMVNSSVIMIHPYILLPTLVIVSYLMISNIRFPKIGKKTSVIVAFIILLVIIINLSYNALLSSVLLSILLLFYIIGGPLYLHVSKRMLP